MSAASSSSVLLNLNHLVTTTSTSPQGNHRFTSFLPSVMAPFSAPTRTVVDDEALGTFVLSHPLRHQFNASNAFRPSRPGLLSKVPSHVDQRGLHPEQVWHGNSGGGMSRQHSSPQFPVLVHGNNMIGITAEMMAQLGRREPQHSDEYYNLQRQRAAGSANRTHPHIR
eukprot:c12537_g1_i2.p1 GENE.c12537_g1_i2~~c12537_g1_i2.p1  ORF type:complete len:168 (-),score=20.07 c12537_g1_i2:122-625(-)